MDTAQGRTMLRMSLMGDMSSAARLSFEVKRRHVPTWRQLLALGFLRDELEAIMRSSGPRPVSDAPRSPQCQPGERKSDESVAPGQVRSNPPTGRRDPQAGRLY